MALNTETVETQDNISKPGASNRSLILHLDKITVKPEDGPVLEVLKDLSTAGVDLIVPDHIYDPNICVLDNGHVLLPQGNKLAESVATTQALYKYARKITFIHDPIGIIEANNHHIELSHATRRALISESPSRSNAFGKVISINTNGHPHYIEVRTSDDQTYYFDTCNPDFVHEFIDTLSLSKPKENANTIKLPEVSAGTTSLDQEVKFLDDLTRTKILNYRAPDLGSKPETILGILLAHSENKTAVSTHARECLTQLLDQLISSEKPIPITMSIAVATRILNRLKFFEPDNLPTYAWMHMGNFFRLINEKIQTIHPAGINVTIFDEATLLGPQLGISSADIAQHLTSTRHLLSLVKAPIQIIPLTTEMFPESEIVKINPQVTDEQIYAVVCSRQDMTSKQIMDQLYTSRDRNYSCIADLVGADMWEDSRRKAITIARHLEYRKQVGLFDKLVDQKGIDATVTDKADRIVFDITSNALFNHAMPLVRRDRNTMHKVRIIPEYRIPIINPNAKPVKIAKQELLAGDGETTFYYIED